MEWSAPIIPALPPSCTLLMAMGGHSMGFRKGPKMARKKGPRGILEKDILQGVSRLVSLLCLLITLSCVDGF